MAVDVGASPFASVISDDVSSYLGILGIFFFLIDPLIDEREIFYSSNV